MIRFVLVSGFLGLCGLTLAFGSEKQSGTTVRMTASFQNGVNEYAGTIDSEIWALAPTTILDGNGNASADADNDDGNATPLGFGQIV